MKPDTNPAPTSGASLAGQPPAFPLAAGSAGFESAPTADQLIAVLERYGLGWSLDHTGNLIEARVWDWPNVIGRYRPHAIEPLRDMLAAAMRGIPWEKMEAPERCSRCGKPFPPKSPGLPKCITDELDAVKTCVSCLQQNSKQ